MHESSILYICTQKSNRKLFLLKPFLVLRYSIGFLGFKSIKKEQLKGEKRRIMSTHNDKGYLVSDQNGKSEERNKKKKGYIVHEVTNAWNKVDLRKR